MSDLHFCFGQLCVIVENFLCRNACIYHKYVLPLHSIFASLNKRMYFEKL